MAEGTWHPPNTFNAATSLPLDLLVMISSFLCTDDVFRASGVCRRWRTILVSSPLLWRKIDFRNRTRMIAGLDRRQSVPLQLELNAGLPTWVLNEVLGHESEISSVFARLPLNQLREFHRWLVTPFTKNLVLFVDEGQIHCHEENATLDLQGDFTSIRRLSVSGFFVPINQITAPNLIHLSLEMTFSALETGERSALDMLRGCSQLETVLINIFSGGGDTLQSCTPVTLPKLRSIELGFGETYSGLIVFLRFPPTVAVGFRGISLADSWPHESIQHALAPIDIESITLAHIRHKADLGHGTGDTCLIRFEGAKGSLEIAVVENYDRDPFGADGLLLSHSPRLDNVKTLRVMDCRISNNTLATIAAAMPNLVSINFTGHNAYTSSLTPTGDSPPLFPHLKHIAGLSPERKLVEMVRAREERGMPLDALVVHHGPEHRVVSEELEEFVGGVEVWRCADLPERWTSNALLGAWETAGYPGPVSAQSCQ